MIGGLPAGAGYSISIAATTTDGTTTCSGSASFAVIAHTTTAVTVHLTCHEQPRTGTAIVNGTVNVCPTLTALSANPGEVIVGEPVALSASAVDSGRGPVAARLPLDGQLGRAQRRVLADPDLHLPVPGPGDGHRRRLRR